ncbi:ABC transporter substrate-binding protein [Kitasatospora herbaricolor]|uniref:ABC transporter permease n=1 Tax=Kitasatospora herbaricolor TaxID=68217 RepID=UPI0017491EF7|nr:ABC transporter permease [Kitasatospora herbaricolor]MDQ0311942.1 putative ABC transport system permease protein [Kitasatospora herbaricolor]GGU97374.1 ABC transporter substrate-binding protein [Kitasatospora herbaricolor]
MFVARRDLGFAKGRFALMGTVIVLITVLVGLLSGLTAGLGRQNISAITGLPADRLVFSAPADGQKLSFTDSQVNPAQWDGWAAVPGVRSAEPLGIGTARATAGARTAALSAFGVPAGSALAPGGDLLAPGRVVLSASAAKDLDVRAGSTLALAGRELTVAAVSGDAAFSHLPVVWTSLADWQLLAPPAAGSPGSGTGAATGTGEHATVIALSLSSADGLADADRRFATKALTPDDSLAAIGSYTSENGSLQLMRGFLFAISALVVGAFFTVWTIQRSGDVAVLKALGASTGYLLRDALGQAVLLLVAGTAVGTAIAVGVGAAVGSAVPFVLDAPTVLVPAAVMTGLGALGAGLSIRRITSVDPLTALGSAR